ncbi:MAG: FliH/SctL family protein [Limnochordia bacterium]|nr:FliH/SctL family protein [Limnochordia bacterium]
MSSLVKNEYVLRDHYQESTYALHPKGVQTLEEMKRNLEVEYRKLNEKKQKMQGELAGRQEAMLAEARSQAEQIIVEARAAGDRIRQEAEQEGWAQGQMQGYEAGQAKANKLIDQARRIVEAAAEERRRQMASLEQDLIKLVCEIAGKLVSYRAEFDPRIVEGVVHGVLAAAGEATRITLRVHPDQVEVIDDLTLNLGYKVEVVPDDSLRLADCFLESDLGDFDGRITSQVIRLEQRLTETA